MTGSESLRECTPLVCTGQDVPRGMSFVLGGKGRCLARLQAIGQPIPPWYAITTKAFRATIDVCGLADWIRNETAEITSASKENLAQKARRIRDRILALELPECLVAAINDKQEELFSREVRVAVRSSAGVEDASAGSFAGLHDSFLFVRGANQVAESVKKVWASIFNERALSYRMEKGIPLSETDVAVVVQQMVDANVSGVLFTANPVSGDVEEIVINSLFGCGEGLVSAGFDADSFTVGKADLCIQSRVACKEEQLVRHVTASTGLQRVPLPASRREEPSLTADQVRALARMGLAIERHFGRPQDIEFAVDREGAVSILQSRPVTTIEEVGPAAGNRIIWDNSNIIESYSGVTSPMTFSFVRRAYSIVYYCFARVMGISPALIRENQTTFENMLGLVRGQVYYNLLNWYRLLRLFPGYRFNAQFMESMMGVKESTALEDRAPEPGLLHRYVVELPALLRLLIRSSWNLLRIRTWTRRFEENLERNCARWEAMDFGRLSPYQLMAVHRDIEARVLWNWKAPIINDFFVMVFYGILKKLCVTWCGDETGSLQNDLICGEGGIESTEPTKMLFALARIARKNPKLRQKILNESAEDLVTSVPRHGEFREFTSELTTYLERYGFRCINELKLEEPSLRDRPEFIYRILQNYLADSPRVHDESILEAREREIRARAEERAFASLGRLPARPLKAILLRRVLENARLGVKNRENMRFARTRVFGILRELIRATGNHLRKEGILDDSDDVFYLTLDEVWDYLRGTAVTTDLKGLSQLRRREFDSYRQESPPADRFETYGMPYHRNRYEGRKVSEAAPADDCFRGVGCCPGEVTGEVKIIHNPKADIRLRGEILVAERTDPGWIPLYPAVSGILIERGSILSHSAIVAREMGIPTIVGLSGLTAKLRTGNRVHMDGSQGTVEILPSPGKLPATRGRPNEPE